MRDSTEKIKARIIASASHLFKTIGYQKTTIRLIVADTGIKIGSIYNIFPNKEAIFLAVADEKIENGMVLINKKFAKESPFFRFLCIYQVHLTMILYNQVVRENYYATYSSPLIAEFLANKMAGISKKLFAELFPRMTLEDFRIRNILFQGIIRSYIMGLDFAKPIPFYEAGKLLLTMIFSAFGIAEVDTVKMIEKFKKNEKAVTQIWQQVIAEDLKE